MRRNLLQLLDFAVMTTLVFKTEPSMSVIQTKNPCELIFLVKEHAVTCKLLV
jgi:hypothetical protein